MLCLIRPGGGGLSPLQLGKFVGGKIKKDVKRGHQIQLDDISN